MLLSVNAVWDGKSNLHKCLRLVTYYMELV